MNIYLDEEGSLEGLRKAVEKALGEGAGGLVILACEANGFTPAGLDPLLKTISAPVIGGTFPLIMNCGRTYQQGSLVLGFKGRCSAETITGISAEATDHEAPMKKLADNSAWAGTMLVFVDFLSLRKLNFINSLFDNFGVELSYIGGGAGSLGTERKPCIISNTGLSSDSAVMMLVENPSGIGIGHGWKNLGEPMQATETLGNIIRTLNFRPAFEVYSEAVTKHTGVPFPMNKELFFTASRKYPFGIARLGKETIVRDPLRVEPDGSIVCAGDVQQDSYISILEGTEESLLAAATEARTRALEALPGEKPVSLLLMDCVSRPLFLGGRFKEEMVNVTRDNCRSAGACTVGEIANSGSEFLEFFNKTVVVAAFEEK